MRIDRYVHDERLTWGAAGVLLAVAGLHAAGIGRLLVMPPTFSAEPPPPIFQVTLEKLPPPRLPPPPEPEPPVEEQARVAPPPEEVQPRPKQTRPVPILVDTPTTDPVPPDTQVKKYELGDELLPGEPGPPMPEGVPDGDSLVASGPVEETPVYWDMKPIETRAPVYPPRCLRMGIEGNVRVRVLVGENGRPQEVTIGQSSGESALDEAAMEAVRQWRFEPARRNGMPVRAWAAIPIEFKLTD